MGIIADKINEATANVTNNIQTTLIDKFTDIQIYMVATFWSNLVDLILIVLTIDIYWCCFCLIMNREYVSIPPFGHAKPMDNLFFLCSFYIVFELVKVNHGF